MDLRSWKNKKLVEVYRQIGNQQMAGKMENHFENRNPMI